MVAAKLRFIRGFAEANVDSAVRDVRQLAALIRSNEVLLAEMVTLTLLKTEQQAHAYASARNLDIQNWTPPSESSLKARREVGRVASHFAFPGVDPEITEHALKCAPSACTALIEASFIHTSMGSFAHRDTYEDFRRQLDAHNCNPDILKAIQQKGGLGVQKARYFFSGKNSLELFRERN